MIKKLFAYVLATMVAASCMEARMHAALAGSYAEFARTIASSMPADARARPDLERLLDQLTNAYRGEKRRAPLAPDNTFKVAARTHAIDMMLNDFLGHRASTGHDFKARMKVFVEDVSRYPAMAENAARDLRAGPADEAKTRNIFKMWLGSGGHRRNLVSRNYALVSTGVIERNGRLWAVQVFFAAPRESGGLFQ